MSVDKSTVSQTSVSDELHKKNAATPSAEDSSKAKATEHKETEQKVKEHKDEAKVVETKGDSPEEKAAERAGVPEPALDNKKQNRAPKNKFEQDNQKETEAERKAAQKESDLSTEKRVEKAEEPKDAGKNDAAKTADVNQGADIAAAIRDGLASSKEDKSIKIVSDDSVVPRFSLVKNKQGEVMIRENETGVLSKLQLQSIEEKEASIQDQEVTEL